MKQTSISIEEDSYLAGLVESFLTHGPLEVDAILLDLSIDRC